MACQVKRSQYWFSSASGTPVLDPLQRAHSIVAPTVRANRQFRYRDPFSSLFESSTCVYS